MKLHVGDSVIVKSGARDPDFGIEIGGWQGRIEEVAETGTVFIRWDSITLKEMGLDLIIRCENENLDWQQMTLNVEEIEAAKARDSEAAVERISFQLRMKALDDPRVDTDEDG